MSLDCLHLQQKSDIIFIYLTRVSECVIHKHRNTVMMLASVFSVLMLPSHFSALTSSLNSHSDTVTINQPSFPFKWITNVILLITFNNSALHRIMNVVKLQSKILYGGKDKNIL